jgi:hypothetical protein
VSARGRRGTCDEANGLALEETWLDLGAKVDLCALAVVLGVLSPGWGQFGLGDRA